MKKKRPAAKCRICGTTRDKLLGKSMPGLCKGKCHKCYVLKRRYGPEHLTKVVRAKIKLEKAVNAIA